MSERKLYTTRKIEHYRLHKLIEQAYDLSREDFEVNCEEDGCAVITIETFIDKPAGISLDIMDSGMTARLSLFPPLNNGEPIDKASVEEFILDEKKLDTDTIDWEAFKKCFQDYSDGNIVYQEIIANGISKEDGTDATYDLYFDIEDKKPKVLADGSVDFKDINNIIMVEKGDVLLRYHKETDGIDGKKVRGEKIPAKKGKKIAIHKGDGVAYKEEQGLYYSDIAGHVTFRNNRLNVNPVYSVKGDVDYSEGNIDFLGTVRISGDVLSGFEVKAKNIVIWGVARDATLIAEEDISVRTGIFSTGSGVTKAGKTVTANFIEGATVYAGTAVIIKNYCYNSKVFCEGEILALSGDGVINGGELYAFSSIEAKKIGFKNSSAFPLHVGVKHSLNEHIEKLIDRKNNIENKLKETDSIIRSLAKKTPDIKHKQQLKSIISNRKILYDKYEIIDSEIENLIKDSMHTMPYVLATKEVNEGIKVVIYNTEYIVPLKCEGGKFVFDKSSGNVVMLKPDAAPGTGLKKGRN
ncbi:protein of unknown function DUF342 [Denitrovibrio acetiphilus DSM 12809]|uniref:Flagellar Assembly Protein A N-terminal region domain-containing protein n=1 Tax=Denitrovibrio acetiphilus (strain DSM 12809 / NBRC 114555 / N2460) TaxID=522772 RepID=D4H3C6_DENA2|nr:FapA family protein [Denitrovibrio acetiphilus]ADD67210.1 protein of unknown function DUF342 [Denitrovibrio acetiphilus DSM 12809]